MAKPTPPSIKRLETLHNQAIGMIQLCLGRAEQKLTSLDESSLKNVPQQSTEDSQINYDQEDEPLQKRVKAALLQMKLATQIPTSSNHSDFYKNTEIIVQANNFPPKQNASRIHSENCRTSENMQVQTGFTPRVTHVRQLLSSLTFPFKNVFSLTSRSQTQPQSNSSPLVEEKHQILIKPEMIASNNTHERDSPPSTPVQTPTCTPCVKTFEQSNTPSQRVKMSAHPTIIIQDHTPLPSRKCVADMQTSPMLPSDLKSGPTVNANANENSFTSSWTQQSSNQGNNDVRECCIQTSPIMTAEASVLTSPPVAAVNRLNTYQEMSKSQLLTEVETVLISNEILRDEKIQVAKREYEYKDALCTVRKELEQLRNHLIESKKASDENVAQLIAERDAEISLKKDIQQRLKNLLDAESRIKELTELQNAANAEKIQLKDQLSQEQQEVQELRLQIEQQSIKASNSKNTLVQELEVWYTQ